MSEPHAASRFHAHGRVHPCLLKLLMRAVLPPAIVACSGPVVDAPPPETHEAQEAAAALQAPQLINYGRWNDTTPALPHLAVHAALLPPRNSSTAAKILFFGGSQHEPTLRWGKNSWGLYNTSTNSVETLGFNAYDAFCSGHAHDKWGNLVVVGGNQYYAGSAGHAGEIPSQLPPLGNCGMNQHKCPPGHFTGEKGSWVFDYASQTLRQGPNMHMGRWYPTVVRIDESTFPSQLMTFGGHPGAQDPVGVHENWEVESYYEGSTNFYFVDPFVAFTDHYPRVHLTPYLGNSLVSPSAAGGRSIAMTPVGMQPPPGFLSVEYLSPPTPPQYGSLDTSSVLLPLRPRADGTYPAGKILLTGGFNNFRLDLDNPSAWTTVARPTPSNGQTRRFRGSLNATILATGDVLVTGGVEFRGQDGWNNSNDTSSRYGEIYREDLNTFHETAAAQISRNYHSVALLMPDGRVWTAGGNKQGGYGYTGQPSGNGRELRYEIFAPWYYYLSRPQISSTTPNPPLSGSWTIRTGTGTTGTQITRVALLAPGSATHAFDVDQRYVELRITSRTSSTVTVNVPGDTVVLPHGYYMLVISRSSNNNPAGQHVPSIARWYRVGVTPPPPPPPPPCKGAMWCCERWYCPPENCPLICNEG